LAWRFTGCRSAADPLTYYPRNPNPTPYPNPRNLTPTPTPTSGTPFALRTYVAMDVVGLLGAVLNVSKVPERWYPGVFDYACNSHMLMHLCAFAALVCCYIAMTDDYSSTYLGALAGTACVHVRG